ncbi:MAG: hypothetical protein V4598_08325 [Bdellovibrionota bacterium]
MKNASWSLFFIFAASLTSLESFAQVRPLPSYDDSRQPRDERRQEQPRDERRPDQPRDPRQPQQPVPQPLPQPIPQTNYPQPFPQYDERGQEEAIEARIQQSLSRGARIRLSQYLFARDSRSEIVSLSITAQSFGPRGGSLQLLSRGQVVENLQAGRGLQQLQVRAINLGQLEDLELSSLDDVYIESISARLSSRRQGPGPQREVQVAANSLVSLRVNQDFTRGGEIQIERLVREQLGQTLQGAQIDRIAVEGSPIGYGQASIQIELNGRIAGTPRALSAGQRMHPIQLQSLEEVRSLRLLVSGSARIMDINIRIGQVRPQFPQGPQGPQGPQFPSSSRIIVNKEISPAYPLDLALLTRELSPVRSLTIETSSRGYAAGELTLMSRQGHTIGRALIAQGRTIVLLTIPTAAADIRIFTQSPVQVGSIEMELERRR